MILFSILQMSRSHLLQRPLAYFRLKSIQKRSVKKKSAILVFLLRSLLIGQTIRISKTFIHCPPMNTVVTLSFAIQCHFLASMMRVSATHGTVSLGSDYFLFGRGPLDYLPS